MKNKKVLIIYIIIILIAIVITIAMNNIKKDKQIKTSFENNTATSEVVLEEIEFKNITKEYEGGITTIRAEVYNNTKNTKSINVKIILKDEQGKEISNMVQTIEKIEPNKKKILQTGIMGNYSNVKDIEFKVLSNEEIDKYNN